jgi:hypothetical protein
MPDRSSLNDLLLLVRNLPREQLPAVLVALSARMLEMGPMEAAPPALPAHDLALLPLRGERWLTVTEVADEARWEPTLGADFHA